MSTKLTSSALILLTLASYAYADDSGFDESVFQTELKNVPHQIKLLNSGLASFEQRLEMIERAKEAIEVEYFIYNADKSGKIFTQALIKKAREGVKVRMILDAFMIKSEMTPFHIHEFEAAGIEVRFYNNNSVFSSLVKGMYRNHRKVIIIDGKEAITGGRNIGDEYFDLKEDFNFLDRELYIQGEMVQTFKKTFDVIWGSNAVSKVIRDEKPDLNDIKYNGENGQKNSNYESDLYYWNKSLKKARSFVYDDIQKYIDEVRTKGRELLQKEYVGTCDDLSYTTEFPILKKKNREFRNIKVELNQRIANAKEQVIIDSPYFIVDDESNTAIESALNNHAKIDVLTNSLNSTDAIYVFDVFKAMIKKMLGNGLTAYMLKGDLPSTYDVLEATKTSRFGVHAKTFIFDNKDVVIGTYNFDPRSANYNAEMTITCNGNTEFASVVKEDIQKRMDASFKLTSESDLNETKFYKVGFLKRITYLALKIPSIVFDYLL
jgi:putative cardiolipin synthase